MVLTAGGVCLLHFLFSTQRKVPLCIGCYHDGTEQNWSWTSPKTVDHRWVVVVEQTSGLDVHPGGTSADQETHDLQLSRGNEWEQSITAGGRPLVEAQGSGAASLHHSHC